MTLLEIILTGLSLSMDAFTVSISKGLCSKKKNYHNAIIISLYFSIFQFIMPILGYYIGNIFSEKIIYYNPYISMILLIVIGTLIYKEDNLEKIKDTIKFSEMIILAIATSIDAFVIGISFSFLKTNIFVSSLIIGITTFIMCLIGYLLGNKLNNRLNKYSNKIAGIILIIIGIKIFLQNILK